MKNGRLPRERLSEMDNINRAMHHLDVCMSERDQGNPIPFEEFLAILAENPFTLARNVFQVFHDMVKAYIEEGIDEYLDDPESINFAYYDCSRLFVEGSDHPFFADRLFANRLINLAEALMRGAQQNKIYIFEGPHGCGKSTFLNNLLRKFEQYANTAAGSRYETVWRLDRKILGYVHDSEAHKVIENAIRSEEISDQERHAFLAESNLPHLSDEYVEIPCPSHDNPILMIPKDCRWSFFDDLFKDELIKKDLFTQKEYEWILRDTSCTVCSSIYQALLRKLKNPLKVFQMVWARPYQFNKRLGEGISVFNPGDKPMRNNILSNAVLQQRLNNLLRDSNQVKYIFSQFAKTNNGIYALMDIKSHNTDRLIELHNIISEGVHKVDDIEENVNSLFFALMNPEDKKNIADYQSFLDRIEYIKIPYVMDLATEVQIYRNIFGAHIDESFIPRVLHNFARVVIATRLNTSSDALLEWIGDPEKYSLYCDKNLQLLKMEIYTGHIPPWLTEKDRKRFTARRRRNIIAESEKEGETGFSGRDSIKIFNEFYSTYAKKNKLINMSVLCKFFTKIRKDLNKLIPEGFLDSMLRMYNFTVLQEVKESLYYYNEEQISRDILNYMFAVNFEIGSVETCKFTGEQLKITEEFLENIENHLLTAPVDQEQRLAFRQDTQKEYTTKTLTQEIMLEKKLATETTLYQSMHERYLYNLKEKVLDPFLENVNFRRAIKDYDTKAFKAYDKKIRADVTFLINNLCTKLRYTKQGAKEMCMYVIDNDLAKRFTKP